MRAGERVSCGALLRGRGEQPAALASSEPAASVAAAVSAAAVATPALAAALTASLATTLAAAHPLPGQLDASVHRARLDLQ